MPDGSLERIGERLVITAAFMVAVGFCVLLGTLAYSAIMNVQGGPLPIGLKIALLFEALAAPLGVAGFAMAIFGGRK